MKKHIILDVDSTLIYNYGYTVVPRPHLEEFLVYCFRNFTTVNIWTAASTDWFTHVYITVLRSILLKYNYEFTFIWTANECSYITIDNFQYVIKPLVDVWKQYDYLNQKNTFIVDDSPITFSQNVKNAIPIYPWRGNDNDKELIRIQDVLEKIINS